MVPLPRISTTAIFAFFWASTSPTEARRISLIREQVEANLCFHCEIVGRCSQSVGSAASVSGGAVVLATRLYTMGGSMGSHGGTWKTPIISISDAERPGVGTSDPATPTWPDGTPAGAVQRRGTNPGRVAARGLDAFTLPPTADADCRGQAGPGDHQSGRPEGRRGPDQLHRQRRQRPNSGRSVFRPVDRSGAV
jgi:hypothetical protein